MKKVLTSILVFGAATLGMGQSCNIRAMGDSCKKEMKPFLYSAQSALHVALKSESQVKDVDVPAFGGEKYRVVINTSSMPEGTEVGVYDADATHKKRKQYFTTQDIGISNFDTDAKSGKLVIEYTIPAASKSVFNGCAVVVIGYENKFADNGK